MVFIIVYALAIAAEFYFVPMFLKAAWPNRTMTSLKYKMVCSGLFVISTLCCILYSNNFSSFTLFMSIGLLFGVLGDLLLHYPTETKKWINFLGGVSFFVGHIFYIIAFSVTMKNYFPDASIFDYRAIIVILGVVGVAVIIAFATKMKLGKYAIPVLAYALVIITMVVSAFQIAIRLHGTPSIVFTLLLGAVLFVLSDITITFLFFGGQKGNRPLKIFNIITYFLGQILLGTSILFIQS